MRELIFIPGLGADHRLFEDYLPHFSFQVLDPKHVDKTMDWDVCVQRLISQVRTTNPVVVGVSFGSLFVQSIGQKLPDSTVVLISGFRSALELPLFSRLLPPRWSAYLAASLMSITPFFVFRYLFGLRSNEECRMLSSILDSTPKAYVQWAVEKLLEHKSVLADVPVFRVHGASDKLVPFPGVGVDLPLPGGHFVVLQNQEEIIQFLYQHVMENS